jgi:hypothetical protein
MRSFKYKIWDVPNKHWVETPYTLTQFGDLLCNGMVFANMSDFEVCEYAGARDQFKTEIFEGNILVCGKSVGEVTFEDCQFKIKWHINKDFWNDMLKYHAENSKVIGHIFDNPRMISDLLKEAK